MSLLAARVAASGASEWPVEQVRARGAVGLERVRAARRQPGRFLILYVLAGKTPVLVHNCGPAGEMSGAMRDLLAKKAGFEGGGQRYILDENLSPRLAEQLRDRGFNVRGVGEMGLNGTKDPQLNQLAQQLDARVITRDRGRQLDGGFGDLAVNIDRRVTTS